MKKSFSKVKIHTKFEKMEVENSLFELTYKNEFAVWDLCRRSIFAEINRKLLNKPPQMFYEIKPIDKFKNIFKNIYNKSILYLLKSKKAKTLVITFRRFKKKDRVYDFVIDPIASKLNDCIYFDFINSTLINFVFNKNASIPSFKVIRHSIKDIDKISKYIDSCIYKSFKISIKSETIITYDLNAFFSGKMFFSEAINSLKCQNLIYSDNGILKCLPYICKKKSIKTFEVQHGGSPGSIMWTYPKKKKILLNKKNCYYSDYFLIWGKYWKKIYNTPSKFIVTGTFYHTKKFNHLDKILFISNKSNYLQLSSISKDIAKALPRRKLLFKLHPEQFFDFNEIKNNFKAYSNIDVITDQITNKNLLKNSSDFVTVRSSYIYQAIQSGCKGHILMQDNFDWDQKILKVTDQFSSSSELLKNLNQKKNKTNLIFYEKLCIKSLLNYI